MQNKHRNFFTLSCPNFRGGGGSTGWDKIPTFPIFFVWRLPLVNWANCLWIQEVSAKICRKVQTRSNKIRHQDILLPESTLWNKMQETIKMKGEFLWSIYIISRIRYLVLWPVDFTFFFAFIEGEPLAEEHWKSTGPFISDNKNLSKRSSTKIHELLRLICKAIKLSPHQFIEKWALKTSPQHRKIRHFLLKNKILLNP